jgi:hypothetical protein
VTDFLKDHLQNRATLLHEIRSEVVGPDPAAARRQDLDIITEEEWKLPFSDEAGEEILRDSPLSRYGAGVLYPLGITEESVLSVTDGGNDDSDEDNVDLHGHQPELTQRSGYENEDEEHPVSLANAFRPSAMGLSFLVDLEDESEGYLIEVVNVTRINRESVNEGYSGCYRRRTIEVVRSDTNKQNFSNNIYVRSPLVDSEGRYPSVKITSRQIAQSDAVMRISPGGDHSLEIVVNARRLKTLLDRQRLLTVSLVNRRGDDFGGELERSIFQAGIRITSASNSTSICPYPQRPRGVAQSHDEVSEEDINNLLYRKFQIFAIGHGCAADWDGYSPQRVSRIWSDVIPNYEMPSLSADLSVTDAEGRQRSVRASMRKLSEHSGVSDWLEDIEEIADEYARWIKELKSNTDERNIEAADKRAANLLISRCETCLTRIQTGLSLLRSESPEGEIVRKAFMLMNRAMLIAQYRKRNKQRVPVGFDRNVIQWSAPYNKPDYSKELAGVGYWRAFQIAFIVMSLKGIVDPESEDRDMVDLIWFPTGGGKTEAYLGLSSFAIFYNRLTNRSTAGVDVLMRYTLRLLTAQQFQRAALLFCAMESIRDSNPELGQKVFRIGLWVGSASTPNTRAQALEQYRKLSKDHQAENPFILLQCPWCGAKMGPHEHEGVSRVLGYEIQNNPVKTVVFHCQDKSCEFGSAGRLSTKPSRPLPISVIDEDLYESPPSLLIGTVDKFAMMAWQPAIRSFFGIGSGGRHTGLPPSLIIQDELHLISGPLGTMVGAYETVIETLCRENGEGKIGPKIVASTATISHAGEQVKALYNRSDAFLFPPSGLDAEDSFFSRVEKDDQGRLKSGRQYVGILGSSYGSMQTLQARVFGSLLQNISLLDVDSALLDPWWTLLCFYNSIRELGGASTLFVADVREYTRSVIVRKGQPYKKIRQLNKVSELTSRIRSDQIPQELGRLERRLTQVDKNEFSEFEHAKSVLDVCLASNIIEVGVDVDRLSLIAIVGQPKTTAQYIQVSSRVGRDLQKPGLVCTLYGSGKPRDRSHYEIFRQYHQRIYSFVEPTSVTPFSAPASERTIHALLVSLIRQLSPIDGGARTPDPFPIDEDSRLDELCRNVILRRVASVSPDELPRVTSLLDKRINQWRAWQLSEYGSSYNISENISLLHGAGMTVPEEWNEFSWPTMTSMRNVDADCEGKITTYFHATEDAADES